MTPQKVNLSTVKDLTHFRKFLDLHPDADVTGSVRALTCPTELAIKDTVSSFDTVLEILPSLMRLQLFSWGLNISPKCANDLCIALRLQYATRSDYPRFL
jgi:hypothetical protein